MLVINLKNYNLNIDDFLDCLLSLKSGKYSNVDVAICPSLVELSEVKRIVNDNVKVFAQHCDNIVGPKSTGFTVAEKLMDIGIDGVVLNHSEHRISPKEIQETITELSKNHLTSIVGIERIEDIATLNSSPDYLLYEASEYIGQSNVSGYKSIVEAKSNTLRELKNKFGNQEILIGAGIKSETDFEEIYRMEFAGVALSSIITESDNIVEKLEEIMMYESQYGSS